MGGKQDIPQAAPPNLRRARLRHRYQYQYRIDERMKERTAITAQYSTAQYNTTQRNKHTHTHE